MSCHIARAGTMLVALTQKSPYSPSPSPRGRAVCCRKSRIAAGAEKPPGPASVDQSSKRLPVRLAGDCGDCGGGSACGGGCRVGSVRRNSSRGEVPPGTIDARSAASPDAVRPEPMVPTAHGTAAIAVGVIALAVATGTECCGGAAGKPPTRIGGGGSEAAGIAAFGR